MSSEEAVALLWRFIERVERLRDGDGHRAWSDEYWVSEIRRLQEEFRWELEKAGEERP